MRIDLARIRQRQEYPEMPPEELARRVALVRLAVAKGGLTETAAITEILPTIARYTVAAPETGKLVARQWTEQGGHRWAMNRAPGQQWADEPRGIMMLGTLGTGKTMAMEIVASMFGTPMLSMVRIGAAWKIGGAAAAQAMVDEHDNVDLIVDDIGAETDARSYGDRLSARDIIMQRYERWRQIGVRTHLTANLRPDQLRDEAGGVGARAYDRLCEMCIPVTVTGDSMRRAKG